MSELGRALIVSRRKNHFDQALTNEDYVDLYGFCLYFGLLDVPEIQEDLAKARMLAELRTLVNSSELTRIFAALPEPVASAILSTLVRPEPRSLEQVIEELRRRLGGREGRRPGRAPRTRGRESSAPESLPRM